MTANVRLGRIAGIDIGVNWSVLIVFALITWALSAVRFPSAYPGHSPLTYILAGLTAAIAFFLGLLAHEISHAIIAMRHGIAVEGITLWIFGGVAQLRGQARTPGAEIKIAGIGPLVSILLGAGFFSLSLILVFFGQTGLLFGTITWLAGINIVIALFNILPAAPLDGGRILHAVLWHWRGDRAWASIVSAWAGRGFGAFLIVLGLLQFLAGGILGGLWLTFIGWFLFAAAVVEQRQARLGQALEGVQVGDVMSTDPLTAPSHITVNEFIDSYLARFRYSAFPITDQGQPSGLVTLTMVKSVSPRQRDLTRLRDIACPLHDVPLTSPAEPLADLLTRLNECAEGRALVIADNTLVGIISPSDINRIIRRATLRKKSTSS